MIGSKYPRIPRSEAHERRSNTSINEKPGNRLKGNTKSNNFYDICNLKTTRMDNMKTCQGTVFGRALLTESLEDLAESLKSYQVSKIERIESMRNGRRSPNGLHILTFSTRTLPEQILCGYERFAVR
jgi:hypothetical protein